MPLRRLPANEAKPTFALPNPNVGKLVQLSDRVGIAADFAIEGIVQLSGRITTNPGAAPKLGYVRIGHNSGVTHFKVMSSARPPGKGSAVAEIRLTRLGKTTESWCQL